MFMPKPDPSFSVVIPTFGRPRGLARLLNSLAPQIAGHLGREVIVVNDGSLEIAYDAVINRHRTWVNYLVAERNEGPGAARNLGAREARGDYLVFIDDDCAAPLDWLDQLTRLVHLEANIDAVGGMTRPLLSARPTRFERLLTEAGCHPNPVFYDDQLIVMVSACLAVRRLVFEEIGGFVERVMPLAEDRNLTTRLRLAGANCGIKRDWFVYHDMTSTPRQHFRRYFNYGRGVHRAIALEQVPLDRGYWPPARRSLCFWPNRARARIEAAQHLAPGRPALERLAIIGLAAASDLAMDAGFIYSEHRRLAPVPAGRRLPAPPAAPI
ncbi:MAG: glycosyltransferase family 2 protein [Stellaceae bacterium]